MENLENKKRLHGLFCLLFFVIGFIVGKAVIGSNYILNFDFSGLNDFQALLDAEKIFVSFKSLIVQFAIIFITSFSPFEKAANAFVFSARGISLGVTAGYVFQWSQMNMNALCFVISYFIVSVVIMIFSCHLIDSAGEFRSADGFTAKLKCTVSCVFLFMMTSGAAMLVRLFPMIAVSLNS